jgi:hypothetical protein
VTARLLLVLMTLAALAPALGAHHSFTNIYFEDDTIEIEGEIIEFQYKNPHAWVQVQGRDPFGAAQAYSAEWASVSRLERDGITARTLQRGDWVRIWASPNRNPRDYRVRLKRIERRSDRWSWGQQNRREER